ncbi:MAG: hypothetical protein ABIK09_14125 [Pseudomonadota bacterium]
MRTLPLLVSVLAICTACGSANPQGKAPVAKLALPLCVSRGAVVQLDASGSYDPDGEITRYIFQIDHREPAFVLAEPYLKYQFDTVLQKGDRYFPYIINVTVQDEDGNRSGLAEPKFMYVLPTDQDCLDNGMEPGVYVYEPPDPTDTVDPVEDMVPGADVIDENAGIDTAPKPDTGPDPDTIPTECPWIGGRYLVQVYHQATKTLELELELMQEGCVISETFGIVEGIVEADGTFTVKSVFPDLHMNECVGLIDDVMYFEVECGGEWYATYTQVP